jgi:hypothetical protein
MLAALYLAALPANFELRRTLCPEALCADQRITPANARALDELNLSPDIYAVNILGLEGLFAAVALTIALVIFARRSDDWMALFVGLTLLTFGMVTYAGSLDELAAGAPAWRLPVQVANFIGSVSFLIFLFVFPDGRFVPRWSRAVVVLWVVREALRYLFPGSPISPQTWPPYLLDFTFLVTVSAAVFAQVYRFRRVSDPIQRQQTKWVVYGVTAALTGFLSLGLLLTLIQSLEANPVILLAADSAFPLLLLLVPLSVGLAILRSRLWEIDLIINRSLVYVPLTGILAGLYSSSITLFQRAFIAVTGERSDAALVISVLVLAATFTPIKNGLQVAVDKRFKDPVDPLASLKEFRGQVHAVAAVIDVEQILGRLLAEAVRTLGASGGAISLVRGDGSYQAQATPGWSAEISVLRLSLCSRGEDIGELLLGPSRTGEPYPSERIELVQQTTDEVARLVHLFERIR